MGEVPEEAVRCWFGYIRILKYVAYGVLVHHALFPTYKQIYVEV